ncbi:putative lipoprotein [Leptospira weilii serovar Topaz str. LT2116]|uniref:Putative lipoprotein n=1 Tax=Leptospira weilii serovar Topaz str. LT2116 TaxID=1088540 RepID=M3GXV9_9LEPT|nr:putative lipoprotein [Leptospira weilii serovar Topaz str. LT2116]
MKHKYFLILQNAFSFFGFSLLFLSCGVTGFTGEHSVVRIPVKTETEVFHANLLHGEVKNLYGINLGIVNVIKERLIGLQVGGANYSEGKTYAAQVGLIYNAAKKGGFIIQVGVSNKVQNDGAGLQAGLYNKGENKGLYITAGVYNQGGSGANVGVVNDEGLGLNVGGFNYGYGVNVGVVNSGKGLSIGALNIGEDGNLQIGILNFCTEGPFPIMIVLNYCSKPGKQK